MLDPLSETKEREAIPAERLPRPLSCFLIRIREDAIKNEIARLSIL
ncbi:MAG TPA: hypothetical protein VFG23_04480 [Polyangia bacterium]|nr:hypothetical protein [Polyangia bacterium]